MKSNFDKCLEMLLEHEGGFVNHPRDPGGMTNLGVTKRVYEKWMGRKVSEQEMRDLTPDAVAPLYKKRYWDKVHGDDLPSGVDWCVFDWAVNSGAARPARAVQTAVGATVDGAIGPKTLAALDRHNPVEIIEFVSLIRQEFYGGLDTFETFGKGWTRRNRKTRETALEMVTT